MISGCFWPGGGQVWGRSVTKEGKLQAQQQALKRSAVAGVSLGMLRGCKMSQEREMRAGALQRENSCIGYARSSLFQMFL